MTWNEAIEKAAEALDNGDVERANEYRLLAAEIRCAYVDGVPKP